MKHIARKKMEMPVGIKNSVSGFIEGLKKSRDIYAECPCCDNISSFHSMRLFYGKAPPKDMISKMQKELDYAFCKLDKAEKLRAVGERK